MIDDFCNIPFGNIKKLVPNFFDKEKYVLHYENLFKKIHRISDFNQLQLLKPYTKFNTHT